MDQPNAPLPEPPSPVAPDAPPAAPEPEPPQGITVDELLARITPRAWVTPTLAVLIVLGFAIEIALGVPVMSPTGQQLLKAGGEFGPLFAEGEWWRALTSMFLHAGPLHLAFNLWAFWSVGHLTERVFGNKAFLTIYVFSGIGGSLASLAWSPLTVGVGASGAIFGVYGALLAFVVLHRGVLPPEYLAQHRNSIVGFIGYNVVFGLSQKNTDMAAHAGGLLTGALAGSVLGRDLLRPAEHALRRALTAVGFAVLLLLVAVFVRARLFDIPEIKADRAANDGLAHLQAKRYPQAIESYTQALTQNREHHWLFNRGLAYYSSDNLKLAQQDMRDAHALQSGAATDTMLCEIGVTLGGSKAELEEAAAHCSAALPLAEDPKKKAALLSMRAIARGLQERDDESGADADAALVLDDGAVMARAHRAQLNLEKGDLAVAESDCGRLLAAEPRAFDLDLCARVAHARKDGAAERVRLDGLLAMRPADQRALLARGWLNGHENRLAESVVDYTKLLAAAPELAVAWNNRAWTEVEMGDFAAARADADRAVALGADAPHLGTRCFALAGLGELAAARADCVRVLELAPDSRVDRGMLAFIDKRYLDARREWLAASAADPVQARELRPWLARLPAR